MTYCRENKYKLKEIRESSHTLSQYKQNRTYRSYTPKFIVFNYSKRFEYEFEKISVRCLNVILVIFFF